MKPHIIVDYINKNNNALSADDARNPTVLPDNFLFSNTLKPIILIRHPAEIIPSFFRVQKNVFKLAIDDESLRAMASLHWLRLLFDAYRLQSKEVIVIDAADLLRDPEGLIGTLCSTLGLEAGAVQYEWDPVPEEHWPKDAIMRTFFDSILRSKGVVKRSSRSSEEEENVGLSSVKVRGWQQEFGDEVAGKMARLVEAEMEDYEYLRGYCLPIG